MKYFSLETIYEAYNGCKGKTQNKFWGLLSILKVIDKKIVPGVSYTFHSSRVSRILDELFSFKKEDKRNRNNDVWSVLFSKQWLSVIPEIMYYDKPNIYDVAIWFYRCYSFPDDFNSEELLAKFMDDFHFSKDDLAYLFLMNHRDLLFDSKKYDDNDLLKKIFAEDSIPNTDKFSLSFESGMYLKSDAGNLGQAAFVQTLYAGQSPQKCLLLTQFDFNKEYRMETNDEQIEQSNLQYVFYGAPGTGKSFEVKKRTKHLPKVNVYRTTFHPDSDYSSFIGTYKPTMKDVESKVVPVVISNKGTVFEQNQGTYKDNKIVYEFVPQVFLKAYERAWKIWADWNDTNDDIIFDKSGSSKKKNIITIKIDGTEIYTTIGMAPAGRVLLKKYIEIAIRDKTASEIVDGWNNKASVSYYFKIDDADIINSNWEKILIGDSFYRFYAGIAGDSWESFCKGVKLLFDEYRTSVEIYPDKNQQIISTDVMTYSAESQASLKNKEVVLIIEEINRGNCAQIFGDVFQLLDRNAKGFSDYPINPDKDIQDFIGNNFKGYEFTDKQKEIINSCFDGKDVAKDVSSGKVLLLPNNLYIWATMNTSDQSLFPIDSAFKRRWEWEYMPIGYKNTNWTIEIGEKEYKWVDFQKEINQRIFDVDNSEDKQLGDYFVNADRTGNIISVNTLLNKILFYIWNDVCKDDPDQIFQWRDDQDNNKEKSIKFSEFFCEEKERYRKLQGFMAFLGIKTDDEVNVGQDNVTTTEENDVVNS